VALDLSPLAPFAVVGAAVVAGFIFFGGDIRYATRHGPVVIRQFIERRGQRLVRLSARGLVLTSYERGLGPGSITYDIVAVTSDGEPRTYRLAFDPRGAKGENSGLKQFADGGWHDAPWTYPCGRCRSTTPLASSTP